MDNVEDKFKSIIEKSDFLYDPIKKALDVVFDFIKSKDLIIYGGMSQDLALKERGHDGLYSDDTLPDFDFYSPTSFEDSLELAIMLYSQEFDNVSAINAMHATTRRVRVMFKVVADISYMPRSFYDKIPTNRVLHGKYKGLRITCTDFIRIDFLSFFLYAFSDSPMEAINFRFEKIVSRFKLLNEYYPVTFEKYDPKSLKMSKIPRVIPAINVLIQGIEAYHHYYTWYMKNYGEIYKNIDIKHNLFTNYEITANEFILPEGLLPAYTCIKDDFDKLEYDELYNSFFYTLRPKMKIKDKIEWHSNMDKPLVYTKIDDKNVVCIQGVMMYFMALRFLHDDIVLRNLCLHIYWSLQQMISDCEIEYEKSYDSCPLFYHINLFGEQIDTYNENLLRTMATLKDEEFEPQLPEFGFYPNRYENDATLPEFGYNTEKFAIDGKRVKKNE
jgi:hypothetical protein